MNSWNGIGRLTADPEVRYTESATPTAVAKFTLAVDRDYKREGEPEADFIRCTAFGKTAEVIEKHLTKGVKIGVSGRIQTGSYDDRETGKKVFTTDIIVSNLTFCEKKGISEQTTDASGFPAPSQKNDFMNIPDNIAEELPFV